MLFTAGAGAAFLRRLSSSSARRATKSSALAPAPIGRSGLRCPASGALAELVCVSIAYLSGGRQLRAVQEEQADLQKSGEDDEKVDGEKENSALLTPETPMQLGVEGGVGRE